MPQEKFWEDNISFVVWAVYWPSSRVDYTERRKTERKKENVYDDDFLKVKIHIISQLKSTNIFLFKVWGRKIHKPLSGLGC